ncbi:MAG: hypothetical protein DRQ39_08920 [Gammaproteobacteria bacterium]|nr:MAG: hypothetical protein DRQ39_08920 [Gammaproteobacteria bacterium]
MNNTPKHVETEYVRLDGDNFTVAPTRGNFYGARRTVSDSEWAEMVRTTVEVERQMLAELNVILTPYIDV